MGFMVLVLFNYNNPDTLSGINSYSVEYLETCHICEKDPLIKFLTWSWELFCTKVRCILDNYCKHEHPLLSVWDSF